jgi:hypothetical protein
VEFRIFLQVVENVGGLWFKDWNRGRIHLMSGFGCVNQGPEYARPTIQTLRLRLPDGFFFAIKAPTGFNEMNGVRQNMIGTSLVLLTPTKSFYNVPSYS